MASHTEIQLSSCSEVPAVASSTSKCLLVMANLKAPTMESRAERAPVSISAVIDKSGSMEGEKMALTKKTLQFVINQLNKDDEFGVVAFSDYVHQALSLMRMDATGRQRAQAAAKGLTAGGNTNLSDGLFLGVDQLKGMPLQSEDNEGLGSGPVVATRTNSLHSIARTMTPSASYANGPTGPLPTGGAHAPVELEVKLGHDSISAHDGSAGWQWTMFMQSRVTQSGMEDFVEYVAFEFVDAVHQKSQRVQVDKAPFSVVRSDVPSIVEVRVHVKPAYGAAWYRFAYRPDFSKPAAAVTMRVPVALPRPPAIVLSPASQTVSEERNDICAVWLFTDGQANGGITDSAELVRCTKQRLQEMAPPCTIFTFGVGSDHDSRMLKELSDAGNGMYYFVKDESSIAQTFADCLGGLLSVVARNIRLTATAQPGCTIRRVHTKFQQKVAGNVATVTIPDLYSEEERDVILEVEVTQLEAPLSAPIPLVVFEVEYHNVLTDQPERGVSVVMLSRPKEAPASAVHPKLDQQRNRVVCLEAIEAAQRLADNHQLAEARQTLDVAVCRITQSVTAAEPLCVTLVEDLHECRRNLRDECTYGATGTHSMSAHIASYSRQRSHGTGHSPFTTRAQQRYSTLARNT